MLAELERVTLPEPVEGFTRVPNDMLVPDMVRGWMMVAEPVVVTAKELCAEAAVARAVRVRASAAILRAVLHC